MFCGAPAFRGGLIQPRVHLFEARGGAQFTRLGDREVGGINRLVNLGEQRSLLDHRAVIDGLALPVEAEGADAPGDLRADIDSFQRFDGASGANRGHQVAAFHNGGDEGQFGITSGAPPPGSGSAGEGQDTDHDDRCF